MAARPWTNDLADANLSGVIMAVVRRLRTSGDWAMPETDNADQTAYWNADAGEAWAALQEQFDAQLAAH